MRIHSRYSIEQNVHQLEKWQTDAYEKFQDLMLDGFDLYPCIPAVQGFKKDSLRFGFLGDPTDIDTVRDMSLLLKEYGEISLGTGDYASVVFFFNADLDTKNTEEYRQLFWDILGKLHDLDTKPWPKDIPKDVYNKFWEFCFEGEQYFVFCSTPAHKKRRSRYFPYFLLALQPRWVFNKINDKTKLGKSLKKNIRERLLSYDLTPAHPDLKWYGEEENKEWKQYFLSEDNSSPLTCPFRHKS